MHLIVISSITYIIAISLSFLTYKIYVFKTHGKWLTEYLRFYMTYGAASVVCIFCLWIIVSFFSIRFWIAQGFIALVGILISYIGNKEFTFNVKN